MTLLCPCGDTAVGNVLVVTLLLLLVRTAHLPYKVGGRPFRVIALLKYRTTRDSFEEIPTEIETRPTVRKVEGQQRKRGRGIDGCRNFERLLKTFMDLYMYLVSSRNKTFDRESLKAFKSLKAYNTLQTILLGMRTLAIFLLMILLQSKLTVCRL